MDFWAVSGSLGPEKGALVATSRVVLACNLPTSDAAGPAISALKKYAKL